MEKPTMYRSPLERVEAQLRAMEMHPEAGALVPLRRPVMPSRSINAGAGRRGNDWNERGGILPGRFVGTSRLLFGDDECSGEWLGDEDSADDSSAISVDAVLASVAQQQQQQHHHQRPLRRATTTPATTNATAPQPNHEDGVAPPAAAVDDVPRIVIGPPPAPTIQYARQKLEPHWVTNPSTRLKCNLFGKPQPRNQCVACLYFMENSPIISQARVRELRELIRGKYRRCDIIAMVEMIYEFYEKHIRGKFSDPEKRPDGIEGPLPPWEKATILEHYEDHDPDFMTRRRKRIDQLNKIMDDHVKFRMYYRPQTRGGEDMLDEDGNPIEVPHPDSTKQFVSMLMTEGRLYGQDPKRALLSGEGGDYDVDIGDFQYDPKRMNVDDAHMLDGTAPTSDTGGAGVGGTVSGQGSGGRRVRMRKL